MTQRGLHVIEVTVEYERAGRSRLIRALAIPVVALILAATVLFSAGGTGSGAPAIVALPKPSRCTIGTIPRVQAGYRPDAATGPKTPAGCP
jgi:hypothetical protein